MLDSSKAIMSSNVISYNIIRKFLKGYLEKVSLSQQTFYNLQQQEIPFNVILKNLAKRYKFTFKGFNNFNQTNVDNFTNEYFSIKNKSKTNLRQIYLLFHLIV